MSRGSSCYVGWRKTSNGSMVYMKRYRHLSHSPKKVYIFVVVTPQCNKLRCVFDKCPCAGLQLFSHCTPTSSNRCIALLNCQREQRQAKTFGITSSLTSSSLCDGEKNIFRIQFSMLLLHCNQNGLDMLITKAICDRLALK